MNIDINVIFEKLQKLEKKHRNIQKKKFDDRYNDETQTFYYEQGFADGVQQSMNEITAIIDEIRMKESNNNIKPNVRILGE